MEEIVLPDTVETIGQGAFLGCQNLKKVVFPKNLEMIQRMAFFGCLKLERIILPGNLKKIGMGAFGYCGMEGCIIPDSVTEIQDGAFARTGLKSINIPAFCVSLGAGVFQECRELTSIIVDERNSVYASLDGVLYDKEKKCLLCYPIAREEKVYSVQNGTEEIAERAFGAGNWEKQFREIVLPDSMKRIQDRAFMETFLDTVWFYGSEKMWTEIEGAENAFKYIAHREKMRLIFCFDDSFVPYTVQDENQEKKTPEKNGDGEYRENGFQYAKDPKRNGMILTKCTDCDCRKAELPEYVDGVPLTEIGQAAFFLHQNLEEIRIPDTVKRIGRTAFGGCAALKKIYLPVGCTCMEEDAFTECRNLTEITVADGNPSFASLDGVLYDVNQKSLVKYPKAKNIFVLKIPEGIERICSHAINQTRLHRVELPASIRYLDEESICGNEKLEELWYKGTRSRWYSLGIPKRAFCENEWGATVRFW